MDRFPIVLSSWAGLALAAAMLAAPTGAAAQPPPGVTHRSFYMGLTPHPYDFTPEAFARTYEIIGAHADLYAHHLDEGVPWQEALDGVPFPQNVREDLARRRAGTPQGAPVFLSITPLALSRTGIADTWGSDSHMPLPQAFAGKTLDDPLVLRAFLNYARRVIDLFAPTYLAYAIEVSPIAETPDKPDMARQFVAFAAAVYGTLKREYPTLKLFPTFVLGDASSVNEAQVSLIRSLLPYTDVLAASTYPYVWDGIGGDADAMPSDWFSKFAQIAPDKPLAIAETGFLAGTFIHLTAGVSIRGTPSRQAAYIKRLLDEVQALRAAFVVWYVPVDYDRLWARIPVRDRDEWFRQWQRAGLFDADQRARPGTAVWDAWFKLPRTP